MQAPTQTPNLNAGAGSSLFARPSIRTSLSRLAGCRALLLTAVLAAVLQPVVWAQSPMPRSPPQNLSPDRDPPAQVARLSLAEGRVSFVPAEAVAATGEAPASAWQAAELNRPLTDGDQLWTDAGARAELHLGSTALRLGEQTSLVLMALNDSTTQLRVARGTVQLRVRTLYEGQRLEIDTPNLAFLISQPGNYRLDVQPGSHTTRVVVQSGGGILYGDNALQLKLAGGQQASFTGTALAPAAPGPAYLDGFDHWTADRDRREDQSVSALYVPRETIGYQQLDQFGDWSEDPTYGAVWLPRALPANWAPYRVGRWSWISPWGWTWVDDAPWGFAPFHYGRWAQLGPRWAWVPGRLAPRPVYAPALVVFVDGGQSWNVAPGSGRPPQPGLGWFPLAPGEAYRPHYRASPRYVSQLNLNINISSGNNGAPGEQHYRYQGQPSAVTTVTREDFARGRPLRSDQPGLPGLPTGDLNRAQIMNGRDGVPRRMEGPDRPNALSSRAQGSPGQSAAPAPPALALGGQALIGSQNSLQQLQLQQQAQQAQGQQPLQGRQAEATRGQQRAQGLPLPGRVDDAQRRQLREQEATQPQQVRPTVELSGRTADPPFRQRINEQAQRGQEQQQQRALQDQQRQAHEQQVKQAQQTDAARQLQMQQMHGQQQALQAEHHRRADELSRQRESSQAQQQQFRARQEQQQRHASEQQRVQQPPPLQQQNTNIVRQSPTQQSRQNKPPQAGPPAAQPDAEDAGNPGRPSGPRNRNPER